MNSMPIKKVYMSKTLLLTRHSVSMDGTKINKSCIRKCFRFENEKQLTHLFV